MHHTLILLVLSMILIPVHPASGEAVDQSGAVIRLLDLLTEGEDSDAFRAALRQLANDRSPTEALADDSKPLAPGSGREDLNTIAGHGLKDLGDYIALHPSEFPKGLPKIGEFKRQRQLGPIFEGMLPHWWESEPLAKRLGILNPLIDESWLDASTRCGAFDFHHLVLTHRGRIRNVLISYQEAGDEVGIIRLGEAIGRNAEPARAIDPREVSTRTLGLFLSGAFGMHDALLTEKLILVEAALGWRQTHPELLNALVDLCGDRSSLNLFEVGDLWYRGERAGALKLLFAKTPGNSWPVASFVNSLLLRTNPHDDEVAVLARLIPTDILVSCVRQLLDDDEPDDNSVWLGCLMMPEFHSRTNRTPEHWIPYSMDSARKTALRWWMDGRNDDALRLLQETYFNLKPTEEVDDMLRFAAISRALGKEASVMAELEKRASSPGYPDLTLHKAALLTVAGNHREALELARSRSPGDLFYRLLIECGEWEALRAIAFGPNPSFKEKHQWLCHAAFLNRDAASARAYFNDLPESVKEQTALLLLLSGNDELCRKHAGKRLTGQLSYSSLPFPISLNPFDAWEQSILDDLDTIQPPLSETVLNYTAHIGMTRDKAKTIGILERLTKAAKLTTNIGGSNSRFFADRLTWQHRIRAARCLIELGAVNPACESLEAMEKEGLDKIESLRNEFWNAYLPARFTTNGFAEYLKVAELELPAATKLERHVFLSKTLAGNPTSGAVRRMLDLLERHRAGIPFNDASLLLQKLSIALCGDPKAPELRREAERVFAFYQPDEKQLAFFQRWAKPAPWQDHFTGHTEIEEQPGNQHDPKSAGFRVLDGMGKIRGLLADQKSGEAASLFREMEIRILLDKLPREKLNVNTRTNQGKSGTSGDHHPEFVPVLTAQCWNLQAQFLRDYALTVWRCGWEYNPLHLAPYLARNGDTREARIAALETQHGWSSGDLNIIRMLPGIDGLAEASEGRVDSALGRLDVCLNLSPFDPTPGMAILNAFKQRGDQPAVQRTAARIRDYWKQRLVEFPDSPQIREASHYWLGELDRSL